jgi:pSer/pThr/pTyr-binding forkhead associated (FHA) protein
MLVHLGGLAGTRVNGEKVTEHLLKHGDEIEIGKQKLLFRLER